MSQTLYNWNSGTTWLFIQLQPEFVKQILGASFEPLGTFPPNTNWEEDITGSVRGNKARGTLALVNLASLAEKNEWKGPNDLGINHDKYFFESWKENTRTKPRLNQKKRNGK